MAGREPMVERPQSLVERPQSLVELVETTRRVSTRSTTENRAIPETAEVTC
nr:hypothetical protein [Propionicimonas sp.]